MIRDLSAAFRELFTTGRSRWAAAALVLLMAGLPIAEILVLRLFAALITDGGARLDDDPGGVARDVAIFLGAFVAARAAHHWVRFHRVDLFTRALGATTAVPGRHSWRWALAFELSTALSGLVQFGAFAVVFWRIDPVTGAVNTLVGIGALAMIARLYRHQRSLQRSWLGPAPDTEAISGRVGRRVKDGERGAVTSTSGLLLVLTCVLWRTLTGHVPTAEAIVLFLGLRMAYGQVSTLATGGMRFARALARSEAPT